MDKALTDFITEYRDYITLFTGIVLKKLELAV